MYNEAISRLEISLEMIESKRRKSAKDLQAAKQIKAAIRKLKRAD